MNSDLYHGIKEVGAKRLKKMEKDCVNRVYQPDNQHKEGKEDGQEHRSVDSQKPLIYRKHHKEMPRLDPWDEQARPPGELKCLSPLERSGAQAELKDEGTLGDLDLCYHVYGG